MFRGKPDEFGSPVRPRDRVLDGQGLVTDSGTHGHRGYDGTFSSCGLAVLHLLFDRLASDGPTRSRMFFFDLGDGRGTSEDDLLATDEGGSIVGLGGVPEDRRGFLTALFK